MNDLEYSVQFNYDILYSSKIEIKSGWISSRSQSHNKSEEASDRELLVYDSSSPSWHANWR